MKALLKPLLLLTLILLVPVFCSAEITVYKGRAKAEGFDVLGPGTGAYYKQNISVYVLHDVDPATGAFIRNFAIMHDNTFGFVVEIFNLESVYDPGSNRLGVFSADLYNEGLSTAGSRFMISGKAKTQQVGNGVKMLLGGNMKGVLINIAGDVADEQDLVLNFDRKFTQIANEVYFGDLVDSTNALVQYLVDRGVTFP